MPGIAGLQLTLLRRLIFRMQQGRISASSLSLCRLQLMNVQQRCRNMLAVFVIGAEGKTAAYCLHVSIMINEDRNMISSAAMYDCLISRSFGAGNRYFAIYIIGFASCVEEITAQ
ncbi:hypothetical protein D3C78_741410 [compost metagenome]